MLLFMQKKVNFFLGTDGFQPLLLLGLIVLEDKKEIYNLYDFEKFGSKSSNYYHPKKNKFELEKASEFKTDEYINKKSNL